MSEISQTDSMKKVTTHPADVTEDNIRSLMHEERIGKIDIARHGSDSIASGFIDAVQVNEEIAVTKGRLVGQRGYNAEIANVPGLNIEVRFAGRSQSIERSDARRIIYVEAGDVLVAGSKGSSMWMVTSSPQNLFEAVSVHFNTTFFENLAKREANIAAWALQLIDTNTSSTLPASTYLKALASRLLETDFKSSGQHLKVEALALEILLEAWLPDTKATTDDDVRTEPLQIIEHAKALIHANPRADLTVEELAKACRISQSQLKSLFKSTLGRSVGAEIRTVRMATANQMLRDGVPITNTASILGYKSPEAFSRAVKQHFGQSPSNLHKS